MAKVHFCITPFEKLAEFVYDLRNTLDESTLKQRSGSPCIFIEFEPELKKELFYAKRLTPKLKEKLVKKIRKKMCYQKDGMNKFLKEIKKKWYEIEEIYFEEMKRFFEFKKDKEFYCYINNCVTNSYFGVNEISLVYLKEFNGDLDKKKKEELLAEATFSIAEEILHLLYFDYIRKLFDKNFTFEEIYDLGDDNYSGWHLTELIPEYLLAHNPTFEKFGWNKVDREKQGYFWITKLRKKTDPIYQEKSFKDFIIQIHKPFLLK